MLVSEMVNQAWGMTPVLPTPLSGNPRQTSGNPDVILPSVPTSHSGIFAHHNQGRIFSGDHVRGILLPISRLVVTSRRRFTSSQKEANSKCKRDR